MSIIDEAESIIAEANTKGLGEQFTLNGKTYWGGWNTPDLQTQMLTGGFQGRTEMTIVAHRKQFASIPGQRDGKVLRVKDNTLWEIREVSVDSHTHYTIHVIRQIGP
jgi:hypothetical protein